MKIITLFSALSLGCIAGCVPEQAPEQAPMRWLVLTAQAQPETLRTHHYCSSVLHVLRTIREVLDPAFRPGKRLRMGVASLRL